MKSASERTGSTSAKVRPTIFEAARRGEGEAAGDEQSAGGGRLDAAGIREAISVTALITIGVTVLLAALYLAGGAVPAAPDLEGWLAKGRLALGSPLLGEALRDEAE